MKIIPVKTGSIFCNKTVLTYGKGFDQFIEIPSISWYVEDGNNRILIDTGMCSTERAHKYHYKNSFQKEDERIDLALKKVGVDIDEIDLVILTHLHWDHCSNLDLFKNAQFILQRKELEYAKSPLPPYFNSYESSEIGLTPPFSNIDFELVEGDSEIVSGLSVISTPGHSVGHQSIIVKGDQNYVIAGDACLCNENMMPDHDKSLEFTMIGRYMDVNDAWRSLERIKAVADVVLPGHENSVFDVDCYQ